MARNDDERRVTRLQREAGFGFSEGEKWGGNFFARFNWIALESGNAKQSREQRKLAQSQSVVHRKNL